MLVIRISYVRLRSDESIVNLFAISAHFLRNVFQQMFDVEKEDLPKEMSTDKLLMLVIIE